MTQRKILIEIDKSNPRRDLDNWMILYKDRSGKHYKETNYYRSVKLTQNYPSLDLTGH